MAKLNFQQPLLQSSVSHDPSEIKKHCWKWLCCFLFFFQESKLTENSKEQHLIETEIFYNIIHVFTVSFDTFKASVLNKSIHFFKKIFDPQTVVFIHYLLCIKFI